MLLRSVICCQMNLNEQQSNQEPCSYINNLSFLNSYSSYNSFICQKKYANSVLINYAQFRIWQNELCSSAFEILISNTNNADFINTFFVFIIQSLHQIKYAFECGTNTKKSVIKDEKCGDGILYVHSFVLFMRSTPWQNAITEHNMC